MQAAVEAVRHGLSYHAAAAEHGVSASGVRSACRRAGVRSVRAASRGALDASARKQKDGRAERIVQATRRWLSGETQEAIAAAMGVHTRTVQDYIAEGMRERAEQREIDLRSMRLHLMEQHIGLAATFGREARAALGDGERADAARCATVMQRSLEALAKMTGADAPAQVQVEHTGPDILAVLAEAVERAPRMLDIPQGATMRGDDE